MSGMEIRIHASVYLGYCYENALGSVGDEGNEGNEGNEATATKKSRNVLIHTYARRQ